MLDKKTLLIILAMAIVTYIPRMLPLVILSKIKLPKIFIRWLKYIPPAVLAALLAPGIFMPEGSISVSLYNKPLIAAIPTFVVGILSKSLFVTVVTGVISMLLLNLFM